MKRRKKREQTCFVFSTSTRTKGCKAEKNFSSTRWNSFLHSETAWFGWNCFKLRPSERSWKTPPSSCFSLWNDKSFLFSFSPLPLLPLPSFALFSKIERVSLEIFMREKLSPSSHLIIDLSWNQPSWNSEEWVMDHIRWTAYVLDKRKTFLSKWKAFIIRTSRVNCATCNCNLNKHSSVLWGLVITRRNNRFSSLSVGACFQPCWTM